MTLGVGSGTLAAGVIVGAFDTSVVTWIVFGATALTASLSLTAGSGSRSAPAR